MEIPRYARDDMLIRWLVEERSGDLRHHSAFKRMSCPKIGLHKKV